MKATLHKRLFATSLLIIYKVVCNTGSSHNVTKLPYLEVESPLNNDWESVELQNNELGIVARNIPAHQLNLICSASYPIEWKHGHFNMDIKWVEQQCKSDDDVRGNNYIIKLSLNNTRHSQSIMTKIVCRQKDGVDYSTINVFVPRKLFLLDSGKTIKANTSDKWIRCPTSNPKIPVQLFEIYPNNDHTFEEKPIMPLSYDPTIGFELNHNSPGIYICRCENETVRVIRQPHSSSNVFETDDLPEKSQSSITNPKIFNWGTLKTSCKTDTALLIHSNDKKYHKETSNNRCNITSNNLYKIWIDLNQNQDIKNAIEIPQKSLTDSLLYIYCINEVKHVYNDQMTLGMLENQLMLNLVGNHSIQNNTDNKETVYFSYSGCSTCSDFNSNQTFNFTCSTSSRFSQNYVLLEFKNGSESLLQNFTSETIIRIKIPIDAVAIKCRMSSKLHSTLYIQKIIRFQSKYLLPPKIIGNSSESRQNFTVNDTYRKLSCVSEGEPKPKYTWKKDGYSINSFPELELREILGKNGGSTLEFPTINQSHNGTFTCTSTNPYGRDQLQFLVFVEEAPANNLTLAQTPLPFGIVGVLLAALTILGIFLFRYRTARGIMRNLTDQEIADFFKGRPELAKQILESQQFSGDFDVLPYDKNYEIDLDDTFLDYKNLLGSGEFAMVVKGCIKSSGTDVAVKIARRNADVTLFKSLLSEVKIMSYIGKHKNVAGLVGVNTQDIRNRNIYIYLDLCELGSLEKYLRENKHRFLNLIDDNQKINPSYYKSNTAEVAFTTLELIRWASEVATGMEYLAYKSIVHADLAARNILLTGDRTVRVSDFGMSKKLYECNLYVKKTKCPLPWRWMALESLKTLTFSTETDVWSYGVAMWEIFSLGDTPFPNQEWDNDFAKRLESGMRMDSPKYSSPEIHVKVAGCWEENPKSRPSFGELRAFFANMHQTHVFAIKEILPSFNQESDMTFQLYRNIPENILTSYSSIEFESNGKPMMVQNDFQFPLTIDTQSFGNFYVNQ